MSEHTKEPLLIKRDEIGYISKSDDQSFGMFCPVADIHNGKEETASRIVACVNACAGVETENISNFRLAAALSYWKNLESQREEMLAALHAVSSWIRNIPHGGNCFVSSHYHGDPGNQCNCGKESILDFVESEISKAEATS